MGNVVKQLIAFLILVGFGSFLYTAWRRSRLVPAFIGLTLLLAALWAFAYAAVWTDYHDADGWIDCWPRCSTYQNTVGGTFVLAPSMFVVLGVLAATLGTITTLRRRRRRGSRRPE
jgi:hypothetical protein